MICARCGTEHNDPENICPRCFYGRPRKKTNIPKWAIWLGGSIVGVAIIAVATIFIVQAVQLNISQRWIDGTWENDEMALIIDKDDRSFHLINGKNVLVGRYELNDEELRLISEEGNHYVYYYELVDELTLNISFVTEQSVVQETLTKLDFMNE